MRQVYQFAGAAFLVMAVCAGGVGVVWFFLGRAFAANISPWEGQIGLALGGVVGLGLYAAARACGRRADAVDERPSVRGAA